MPKNPLVRKLTENDDDDVSPEQFVKDSPDTTTIRMEVELVFSEPIGSVESVIENVRRTLVMECINGNGLAPGNEDAFTESISVSSLVPGIPHVSKGPV